MPVRCFYNMSDIETTDAVLHYFGVYLRLVRGNLVDLFIIDLLHN